MGPIGPPETIQALGPHWEKAKRPLLLLLAALLGIVLLLWWLTGRAA